jgi:hypothetical protein
VDVNNRSEIDRHKDEDIQNPDMKDGEWGYTNSDDLKADFDIRNKGIIKDQTTKDTLTPENTNNRIADRVRTSRIHKEGNIKDGNQFTQANIQEKAGEGTGLKRLRQRAGYTFNNRGVPRLDMNRINSVKQEDDDQEYDPYIYPATLTIDGEASLKVKVDTNPEKLRSTEVLKIYTARTGYYDEMLDFSFEYDHSYLIPISFIKKAKVGSNGEAVLNVLDHQTESVVHYITIFIEEYNEKVGDVESTLVGNLKDLMDFRRKRKYRLA